jgi:hypothetical protein
MRLEALDHAEGTTEAPDLAVSLHAGPLRLVFDRGALRWIRLGEREVLRGIYVAVRDPEWVTVPGRLEGLFIGAEPESFRVRFVSRHRRGPIHFEWEGRIEGAADGRIAFTMDGVARSTFLRNRIGLCILHPIEGCAGGPCETESVDAGPEHGVFPRLVSPHQPFLGLRAIAHEAAPGVRAEVRLEGEVFEMEDQRNWSDDSFKTYGTPLGLPRPVEVVEGTRVRQSVTVDLRGLVPEPVRKVVSVVPGVVSKRRGSTEPVVVGLDAGRSLALPAIGLGGAGVDSLGEAAVRSLRPLRLDHLRADLHLEHTGWEEALDRAARNARQIGAPLEIALFLPERPDPHLSRLAREVERVEVSVACWLVFRGSGVVTGKGDVDAARAVLERLDPRARFAGGTDGGFVELNRSRPGPPAPERLSFALTPQAHAFDDATLFENLATLPWLAETAQDFAGDVALRLSPVTLRPRIDPTPAAWRAAGEPPLTDDPRQAGPLALAWTLGLLAAAAESGYESLTLFEIVGPRGVLGPDGPYPVHAGIADVRGVGEKAVVVATRSRRRERVQCLGLRSDRLVRLFLANVTPEEHPVRIEGLAGGARRARVGDAEGEETGLELTLAGHEVARLDVELRGHASD